MVTANRSFMLLQTQGAGSRDANGVLFTLLGCGHVQANVPKSPVVAHNLLLPCLSILLAVEAETDENLLQLQARGNVS